jgi:hypothetical protein
MHLLSAVDRYGLPHDGGRAQGLQNGQEFKVKKGDVYTCATGTTEEDWNEGDVAAVMRVILLLPA